MYCKVLIFYLSLQPESFNTQANEYRECQVTDAERDAGVLHIIQQLKKAELLVVEGTLYPLLTRLKNDGLLQYEWQESTQGPPRKYYALSPEGEQFLEGLDSAWTELANTINYLKNITPQLLEVKR